MNYSVLFMFLFWYGVLFAFFIAVPSEIQAGSINYNLTDDLNTSDFNPDSEITGSDVGLLNSIGRFLAFSVFGFGLPDDTPFYVQALVSIFNFSVTLLFVAWVIGAITGS